MTSVINQVHNSISSSCRGGEEAEFPAGFYKEGVLGELPSSLVSEFSDF